VAGRSALAVKPSSEGDLMSFIQIIEMRSKNYDELKALGDEFFEATEGKRTVKRSYVTRDRNDPDRYVLVVFFDTYESAMENSNLPETAAFAAKQMPLLDGPPNFSDLDLIEERT
jgi:quinol monooxygenase YgiN